MRRAVAALALASFTAAGCGETLVVTGATMTSIGGFGAAIPDEPEEDTCGDAHGCIDFDVTPSINEGAWLLTGLVLMMAGVVAIKMRDRTEQAPAEAPPPPPIAQAPEPVELPETFGAVGRWRAVPPVVDDAGDE